MNDEVLIEFIKNHPELYDTRHCRYTDRHFREKAWDELALRLKISPLILKSRWRSIRSNYRNALKRLEENQNATVYKYHKNLAFIRPFINFVGCNIKSKNQLSLSNENNRLRLYEEDDPLEIKIEEMPFINLHYLATRKKDSECSSSDIDDEDDCDNTANGEINNGNRKNSKKNGYDSIDYDGDLEDGGDDDDGDDDDKKRNFNGYKMNNDDGNLSMEDDKTGILNPSVQINPVFPKIAKVRLDSETISRLPTTEKLPDTTVYNPVYNHSAAGVSSMRLPVLQNEPVISHVLSENPFYNQTLSTCNQSLDNNSTSRSILKPYCINQSGNFSNTSPEKYSHGEKLVIKDSGSIACESKTGRRLSDFNLSESSNIKRKKIDANESSVNEAYKYNNVNNINSNSSNNNSSNSDHIDSFLSGIATTLRTFNPYQLNIAKTKIFSSVQELELEQIMSREQRYVIVTYNQHD